MKKWFDIQNNGESAEILIYDVIGKDFFGEGVGAEDFAKELSNIKTGTINVRINSPGGSVMDGTAIYNTLKAHNAKVNVFIEGWALSAASFIAMAGDHVSMADNAMFMIHNPLGMSYGEAEEHRKAADMQDKAKELIIKTYQNKVDMNDDEISELMNDETWMTAEEAQAFGFVDEVTGGHAMAACHDLHLLKAYRKMPENIDIDTSIGDVTTQDSVADAPENTGRGVQLLKKQVQLLEID